MPSRKAWLAGLAIIALGTPCVACARLEHTGDSRRGCRGGGRAAGLIPGAASSAGSLGSVAPQSTGFSAICRHSARAARPNSAPASSV